MVQIPRSLVSVVMMVVLSACGPSAAPDQADSEVMGFGSIARADFSALFKSSDIKPSQALYDSLKASLVRAGKAQGSNKVEFAARSEFQAEVFRQVVKNRGVLSDQLHDTLRQILASNACDGASCARVFGVRPSQVDRAMDDMLKVAEKSEALKAPEAVSARQAILSSFRRLSPDKTLADIRGWFESLRKGKNSSEGTCLVPAVTAFGTHSNGPFPEYAPTKFDQKSIDYRNPAIEVKTQHSTYTCHSFAMTSLLAHSQQKGLTKAKRLDVERTVVAIWLSKLGRDVDSALSDEIEFLQKLVNIHSDIVQKTLPAKRESADRIFTIQSLLSTKSYKQGGTAQENFDYLQKFGGVYQNPKIAPLDFKKVDDLTIQLSLARFKYLTTVIKKKIPITPEGVDEALRQPLQNIFDFAKNEHVIPDTIVAKELRRFRNVTIEADKSDTAGTFARLTSDLADHGPLYVSANGHATTLVGYDKDSRVFWITDSRDRYGRAYIRLAEEDLVRTIRAYSYIKRLD